MTQKTVIGGNKRRRVKIDGVEVICADVVTDSSGNIELRSVPVFDSLNGDALNNKVPSTDTAGKPVGEDGIVNPEIAAAATSDNSSESPIFDDDKAAAVMPIIDQLKPLLVKLKAAVERRQAAAKQEKDQQRAATDDAGVSSYIKETGTNEPTHKLDKDGNITSFDEEETQVMDEAGIITTVKRPGIVGTIQPMKRMIDRAESAAMDSANEKKAPRSIMRETRISGDIDNTLAAAGINKGDNCFSSAAQDADCYGLDLIPVGPAKILRRDRPEFIELMKRGKETGITPHKALKRLYRNDNGSLMYPEFQ